MFGKFIYQQRTKLNLSQDFLAKELGISRPTFIQIEKDERDVTISEAKKLADIFNLSLDDFLNTRENDLPEISFKKGKKKLKKKEKQSIRISVPQEKVEKFEQTLLYILAKIGGRPNIGMTAIYKLLYFIDFDFYEKFEEQLIGAQYMKNTHGPTPIMFPKIIKKLIKEGKLEEIKSKFYQYPQTKYLVNPEMDLDISSLSARELEHINYEMNRLGDLSAKQLSDLSHLDTPWVVAEDKEILNYENVFYRPVETSVREYDAL